MFFEAKMLRGMYYMEIGIVKMDACMEKHSSSSVEQTFAIMDNEGEDAC